MARAGIRRVNPFGFIVASLAIYRMTRLIVLDNVFDIPRDKLFNWLAHREKQWADMVMDLLSCEWCVSVHVAFWGLLCAVLLDVTTVSTGWAGVLEFGTWWMALTAVAAVLSTLVNRVSD